MILMTKNGAYMHCYNPKQVEQAEAKGWAEAEKPTEPKPAAKKRGRPRKAK